MDNFRDEFGRFKKGFRLPDKIIRKRANTMIGHKVSEETRRKLAESKRIAHFKKWGWACLIFFGERNTLINSESEIADKIKGEKL